MGKNDTTGTTTKTTYKNLGEVLSYFETSATPRGTKLVIADKASRFVAGKHTLFTFEGSPADFVKAILKALLTRKLNVEVVEGGASALAPVAPGSLSEE